MKIDDLLMDGWPDSVRQATAAFRQGDLFADPPFVIVGRVEHPTTKVTYASANCPGIAVLALPPDKRPRYAVLTSQTCDIDEAGEPRNPFLQCAAVVDLAGSLSAGQDAQIKNGVFADFVYLTEQPEEGFWVADLRWIASLEKGVLVGRTAIQGFTEERQRIHFAERMARRVQRPAFAEFVQDHVIAGLNKWIDKNWSFCSKKGLLRYTGVEEVALRIDGDRLAPNWIQVVVFEQTPLVGEDKASWNDWRDQANGALKADQRNHGLTTQIHPVQFASLPDMRATEYRALVPLFLPALRRGG